MFDFSAEALVARLIGWILIVFSLSVHEWAHAATAFRLGDDTAARLGRMTVDPRAHIDPIGTIILPLLGVPFGWAKPVPVNPSRFRRDVSIRFGMMLTAAAGPVANLAISLVAGVIVALIIAGRFSVLGLEEDILSLGIRLVGLNMGLALFNLLPVPPLDGSRIADWAMPRRWRPTWEKFQAYAPAAFMLLILLPNLGGISLFSWPISLAYRAVLELARLLS